MRKQDQLLELIKTLTASEKRYFKVFCKTQTGNKNYVALFDELEKCETYDAKQLTKKLKVTPASLANDKEYLQEVLLRSMRLFHEHSSIENTLQVEFMEASLLFKKGLITYSLTQCNKLMAKAMKYERFTMALNIGRLQSMCYTHLRQYDELKKANERETELLATLSQYSNMIHLRDRLLEPMLRRKDLSEVADIAEDVNFNTPPEAIKSTHALICQCEVGMFYYQYIKPNADRSLEYALRTLEAFKQHKHFVEITPGIYYGLLSKLCVRYHGIGNFEKALYYVDMLIDETEDKKTKTAISELRAYNYGGKGIKTTLLLLNGMLAEAAAFAKQHYYIIDELKQNERSVFIMDYALSSFHTGNYDACHKQLNLLIDDNTTDRLDIQLQARLLFIILQIQLKNYSLIPYQTKSLKGWIKKTKANIAGAENLISWLDKLAKADVKHKLQETFKAFKQALKDENLQHISKVLALNNWNI